MGQSLKKDSKEEQDRKMRLRHKYANRITIVKYGKECLDNAEYPLAVKRFSEYLDIIAQVAEVQDIYSIRPGHFDPKKDITEMLMISHVYFELARLYDAVPKYQDQSQRCLDQFVLFSANQPYQVVNSELVRKNLKKSLFKNREAFHTAYMQIYVQSKKCYVATFCLGDQHPVTQELRAFKDVLLEYPTGQAFVRIYYKHSSALVSKWQNNSIARFIGHYLVRPMLVLFSKTILPLIMK